MKTLDNIALKYNTDKSSKLHNYTRYYEKYFTEIKERKLKILEIGIQNGFSLKTWKEYFINSEIYGIDIVNCNAFDEERIKTLQGNQVDLNFLKILNEQYGPFDIIIDDGSHINDDMKTTFEFMFPLLKNDGIYIVEDLHCCYWPSFTNNTSFMDMLKTLLDKVNSYGKSGLADIKNLELEKKEEVYKNMDIYEKYIEYIHLYRSIVFIKKSYI